jgi:uncharacterized protein YfiM (DUF2279 family)
MVALPSRADSWWGTDKALHFGISVGVAASATAVTALWIDAPLERAAIGALSSLTVGVAKELFDSLGLGQASFRDLTWDLIGSVIGAALAWAAERWVVTPLLHALAPTFVGSIQRGSSSVGFSGFESSPRGGKSRREALWAGDRSSAIW